MRLKHYMYVDRSHIFISFKMVIKVVRKIFLSFHLKKTLCPEIHFDFTEIVTAQFVKLFENHIDLVQTEIFFFKLIPSLFSVFRVYCSKSNDMKLMFLILTNIE
jgi:hypothetical protein